jgi:hypothetical protein
MENELFLMLMKALSFIQTPEKSRKGRAMTVLRLTR